MRVAYETFINTQQAYIEILRANRQLLQAEVQEVANRFKLQYDTLISQAGKDFASDERLRQRTISAAQYFTGKLINIVKQVVNVSEVVSVTINNKATRKKMKNAVENLKLSYSIKMATLKTTSHEGFSVKQYLKSKAQASITDSSRQASLSRVRKNK